MNMLAEQQLQLQHAIVSANTTVPSVLRTRPDREPLLRIYQHAYTARLVAALRDNYGVLPLAMGDEAFDALAHAYLQAHPSRQPSIRWFGDQLAEFMTEQPDLVPHPAFIDLARMEWALRSAFDAPNAEPLTAAALATRPAEEWPEWVPQFHPSVCRLPLQWHIGPAWRALQGTDGDVELPEPEAVDHTLLVWRPALETRWRSVASTIEDLLLDAAWRGEPFAILCVVAAEQVGEEAAAVTVVGVLQQWVGEGLLAG